MAANPDLSIFIVGPVGAGKTVFGCMLNQYVRTHREHGVSFKITDWPTKLYFANIKKRLNKQQWPIGNTRGSLTVLNWEWKFGGRHARFSLIDPPGEDIESELKGESAKLGILERIRNANVLFVLIDLHEHQGKSDYEKEQNAWIVENVLDHADGVQRVVIGVSKGDLMEHLLPSKDWTDKRQLTQLISKMMPEFDYAAHKSQIEKPSVQVVMLSAVWTEPYLDKEDQMDRRPTLPLTSEGLGVCVDAITEAYRVKRLREQIIRLIGVTLGVLSSKKFWIGLVVCVILYFLFWIVVSIL
jgi:hypothetical protein